jgi:hypothetical protein
MSNFIVSDFFAGRAKLNIQKFIVESVEFELMALDGELKEKVELCESYEDMLSMAADSGLSYNRKRVTDDAELAKDIDMLWSLSGLDVDCDPCIKYRVGEKVCEISGLTSALEEMLQSEKEDVVLNGDGEMPLHEEMGKIETEMNAHNNITQS